MHAGHRQNVAQPRLGEGRVGFLRDLAPVAGQNGREKPGGVPGEEDLNPLSHGPGRPGGVPAGAVPGPLADLQVSPAIDQEEDPLGGEGGNVLVPDAGGVLEAGLSRDRLARNQVQQFPAAVEHRPAGQALQPDRRPCAEVALGGVAAEGGGDGFRPPRHRLGGPLDLAGVQPAPAQAQGQRREERHAPPPPLPGQRQGQNPQGKGRPGPQQYPAVPEEVLGQEHAQGEAPGEHRQPPHLPASGGGRPRVFPLFILITRRLSLSLYQKLPEGVPSGSRLAEIF